MIFKSIKWRLQIYYGLILVGVLAGLGVTAYKLERDRRFQRLDEDLRHRFNTLVPALRPPHRRPDREGPPLDGPPPDEESRPPLRFHLPPQAADLFDPADPYKFYYVIENPEGQEIARSSTVPRMTDFYAHFAEGPVDVERPPRPKPANFRTLLGYREMSGTLPSGETIFVGCDPGPELAGLRLTALKLTGAGAIILFFGLAGGAWLVSRALRPIDSISDAALKISAGDLSQRISTAETESELGRLATVLNATFARLEAAFGQEKQFTSDAAHELRTPVTVILTQTQTALTRERTVAEYQETIEACQRAAQRMRKLIGALLELARLDAGQEPMNRDKFDLSRTAHDCAELIVPLAKERGIKIECQLNPTECSGDSERIAQVITNLLANAIEYNRPQGEVRLTVQAQNGVAILTVTDTGMGIPAADVPRLFGRFYRVDKARSAGHSGLGLAISRAIVTAHGGSIDVSSVEDAGTTFTVRLP